MIDQVLGGEQVHGSAPVTGWPARPMHDHRPFGAAQLTVAGVAFCRAAAVHAVRAGGAFKPERDRTVIDQRHLHAGAESPGGDLVMSRRGPRPAACSNSAAACAGSAAGEKPGRLPRAVSAASVNCGTSNKPPPTSRRLRFIGRRRPGTRDSRAPGAAAARPRGVIATHDADQGQQAHASMCADAYRPSTCDAGGQLTRWIMRRSCSGKSGMLSPYTLRPLSAEAAPHYSPESSMPLSMSRCASCVAGAVRAVASRERAAQLPAIRARQRARPTPVSAAMASRTTRTSTRPTACRSSWASILTYIVAALSEYRSGERSARHHARAGAHCRIRT